MSDRFSQLDNILRYMNDNNVTDSSIVFNGVKLEHDLCVTLLDKLYRDGYVSKPFQKIPGQLAVITGITSKGRDFIVDEGGYTSLNEIQLRNKVKDQLEFSKLQDEVYKLQKENADYDGKLRREKHSVIIAWIAAVAGWVSAIVAYLALK